MDIIKQLADELGIRRTQVRAAVDLMDAGCTVPFIARYRKEATDALNDEILRHLEERLAYLRSLEERKAAVIASIEEQGQMTETLRDQIEEASALVTVEDLYRPYKPKRRTRASAAKEKGLSELADLIRAYSPLHQIEEEAAAHISEENGIHTIGEALAGARDIIAEMISDEAVYRGWIRRITEREGTIISKARNAEAETVYEIYCSYEEEIRKIPDHRVLAINRGEREKLLTVRVGAPEEKILAYLERQVIRRPDAPAAVYLKEAVEDSYERLIAPSVSNEIRSMLTDKAQENAITVFGKNLKQLLMQPPAAGHVVLGWDPAFRTGCKLAVVDETGRVLDTSVIYPTAPASRQKKEEAAALLRSWISKYHITLISVGNGTASRESEAFIAQLLKEIPEQVRYVIVNEAGASVYSASRQGAEEFPDFDTGQRSAVSIARRLQDPLAELVKIDPRSIGVGQYQHDLNQGRLSEALTHVVEDCVNSVGVDVNTASAALLSYISGISASVARSIVTRREEYGPYRNRNELKKVPRLGPKAFEQCAGFLRIKDGAEMLDRTGVHPESYETAARLISLLGYKKEDLCAGALSDIRTRAKAFPDLPERLSAGKHTLADIISELEKPGRDPREKLSAPVLRSDVLEMKDLQPGMLLKGTVRNITDFGAFVDIGVHQDGLVHISQMSSDRYVRHPMEVVSVGDIVDVRVLSADPDKKRISLTMKLQSV